MRWSQQLLVVLFVVGISIGFQRQLAQTDYLLEMVGYARLVWFWVFFVLFRRFQRTARHAGVLYKVLVGYIRLQVDLAPLCDLPSALRTAGTSRGLPGHGRIMRLKWVSSLC